MIRRSTPQSSPKVLRRIVRVLFICQVVALNLVPLAQANPQLPTSIEGLVEFLNHCIADRDVDCFMAAVYDKGVNQDTRLEFRSYWGDCLTNHQVRAGREVDSDYTTLSQSYEKDGWVYSLPIEPVDMMWISCEKPRSTIDQLQLVGVDSGFVYLLLKEPHPIPLDSVEIRKLAIEEANSSWSQPSDLLEDLSLEFPGHESTEYRAEVAKVLLDLLQEDQILLFKIRGRRYPQKLEVDDELLSPERVEATLKDAGSWVPYYESEESWSLWYRLANQQSRESNSIQ